MANPADPAAMKSRSAQAWSPLESKESKEFKGSQLELPGTLIGRSTIASTRRNTEACGCSKLVCGFFSMIGGGLSWLWKSFMSLFGSSTKPKEVVCETKSLELRRHMPPGSPLDVQLFPEESSRQTELAKFRELPPEERLKHIETAEKFVSQWKGYTTLVGKRRVDQFTEELDALHPSVNAGLSKVLGASFVPSKNVEQVVAGVQFWAKVSRKELLAPAEAQPVTVPQGPVATFIAKWQSKMNGGDRKAMSGAEIAEFNIDRSTLPQEAQDFVHRKVGMFVVGGIHIYSVLDYLFALGQFKVAEAQPVTTPQEQVAAFIKKWIGQPLISEEKIAEFDTERTALPQEAQTFAADTLGPQVTIYHYYKKGYLEALRQWAKTPTAPQD